MKFFLKKARGGRRAAGGGAAPRVAARVLQLIRNAPVYKALAKHPPHAAQATILYVLQHSREDALSIYLSIYLYLSTSLARGVGSVSPTAELLVRPPTRTSRAEKHRLSTACTKQSAQSHSQSAFARSTNGGGGEDMPPVLGG